MLDYIKLVRPLNCAMTSLAVLIGAYVSGQGLGFPLTLAMLSAFFICGGGMVINDYYDRDLDFMFTPEKPIPSGRVSLKAARVFSFLLFALGIYLSFWINIYVFILAIVNSSVLYMYARSLQKKLFLSNLTVSFLVFSSFAYGGLIAGSYQASLFLGLMAFFSNTSREIIKDIEDKFEDAANGVNSLPIVLGRDRSILVANIFVVVAILLSPLPYFLNILGLVYLVAVIPSVLVFFYTFYIMQDSEIDSSRVQKFLKIGMLLGLLAFLVGGI